MNPLNSKTVACFLALITASLCLMPAQAVALDPPPAPLLTTDTDGDGQADVAEYFTGTNPSPPDALRLDSVRRLTSPNRVELSWPSISGRSYSVQKSTGPGVWSTESTVTANSGRTTMTVPFDLAQPGSSSPTLEGNCLRVSGACASVDSAPSRSVFPMA